MAERWEISPDGTVYTFHLRADALWTNGAPVTAGDFVNAWHRALAPETAARNSYQLYYLKNGQKFNDPAAHFTDFSQVGVHALDDRTLQVELEHPTPFFLDLCCTSVFLPVHLPTVQRWGDAWTKPEHLVGNGAFTLAEWRLNDRMRLRKNPRYWDRDHVRLDTVDALPISQANVALNFFSNGECDLLMDKGLVPVMLIGDLRTKAVLSFLAVSGKFFHPVQLHAPAVQRSTRAAGVCAGRGQAAHRRKDHPRGRNSGGLVRAARHRRLPAAEDRPGPRSRTRPAAAGRGRFPRRTGFSAVRVSLQHRRAEPVHRRGVEKHVRARTGRADGFAPAGKQGVPEHHEQRGLRPRPVQLGRRLRRSEHVSRHVGDGQRQQSHGWSDARYDQLVADAGKEFDPQKRFDIFRRAEEMLISEGTPICPLYYYVGIQLYDGNRLGGVQGNVLDEHPIREMYRKP